MNLAQRGSQQERMDTDCVDFDDYSKCLRDLSRVNAVTLTHRPMLGWLARHAGDDFSLLDIACGHGDALRKIRARYPRARLTGIDLNPWAIRAAGNATDPAAAIELIHGDAFAYVPDRKFDFIITSQFTHHLTDAQVVSFLGWLQRNAGLGWFIGDLERSAISYYGFPVLARLLLFHRFVREDGRISITRAFIRKEWEVLLQRAGISEQRAAIAWYVPFRLCVATR